jgi:hypothetical protein
MNNKNNNAAVLRHYVQLLRITQSQNSEGQIKEIKEDLGWVWTRVKPLQGEDTKPDNPPPKIGLRYDRRRYKIVMRKYFNSNARHAYINGLRYKKRVLDIVIPFQSMDDFWYEAVGIERSEGEKCHG